MNPKIGVRRVVLAGAAVALVVTAACSTETATTTTVGQETTTTAAEPIAAAPEDLLEDLASLWIGADWAGIDGIAAPGVSTVAEQLGQPDDVNVVWIPECSLDANGTGSCELLVYAGEGSAWVYSARYGASADGTLSILELLPGGDAG